MNGEKNKLAQDETLKGAEQPASTHNGRLRAPVPPPKHLGKKTGKK